MTSEEGKSKGFGFISFEAPEQAEAACDDLDGKELNGKKLFVGRAQKKAERQAELKRKFEMMKMERLNRYQVHYTGVPRGTDLVTVMAHS